MSFKKEDVTFFDTTLDRRIEILAAFTETYMFDDHPRIQDFFNSNELGLNFAYGVAGDLCILTDKGAYYVNQTWWELCDMLGIEWTNDYEDLHHFLKTGWL